MILTACWHNCIELRVLASDTGALSCEDKNLAKDKGPLLYCNQSYKSLS